MDEVKKEILKNFVSWTKFKVIIHLSKKEVYPKIKEVWWVSLGQNVGVEINGKNENFERPVLVLKVFNRLGVLIVPISSTIKEDQYCIQFKNPTGEDNIVNMSQVRSISTKRFIRKVGEFNARDFEKVKEKFKGFF